MTAALRLILLAIGLVGVLCLWLWERRRAAMPREESAARGARFEPAFDSEVRGIDTLAGPSATEPLMRRPESDPDNEPEAEPAKAEAEDPYPMRATLGERPVPSGDPPLVTLDDLPEDLDEVVLEPPTAMHAGADEPTFTAEPRTRGGDGRRRIADPPVVVATREPTIAAETAPDSAVDTATGIEAGQFDGGDSMALEARDEEPAPMPPRHQRIISIRVLAREQQRVEGRDLKAALSAEGLEFGRYSIFHRAADGPRPLYSVASLVEPGSFDLSTMESMRYPGVSLFAVFPGPLPAPQCFDEMLASARRIADRLGATLQDDSGSSLTGQRVLSLREDLVHFEHLVSLSRSRPSV